MAEQSYSIEFDGYYREPNKDGLPGKSGIYSVYRGIHNVEEKNVSLKELIYIGESVDINARVADHDRLEDWTARLREGEVLCYSYALVPTDHRVRVEAALIHKHKPPLNTEYVDAFPFDKTTISIQGKTRYLTESFSVLRR
ncbi:GIY-YIG nuclease family protein [Paraburkholderia sp. A1RO-5]|uniref:GIY-YIG nuclease family protein n=1 Tax=Paraburkholderia sp. A1RO-5 TaxID=3028369 RepID=UPI003B81FF0C